MLFVAFLSGMKLSFDFVFQYSKLRYISMGPDSSYIFMESIQAELANAQSLAVHSSNSTASILLQTIDSLEESISSTTTIESTAVQNEPAVATLVPSSWNDNQTTSDYAYAYVIGGCDPDNPSYRGFLYNIMVSTRLLRDQGSTNDVVAFFQLSYRYQNGTTLPDDDLKALRGLDIRVYYIPPSPYESFYETVLNKFRILYLTQYKRIILMDGDVMPVSNLDFIFELSDDHAYGPGNSTLKENLVVAGPYEPANAGFFMLAPREGEYDKIREIIATREEKVKDREGNKFDELEGWGHIIEPPDEWVSRRSRGTNWTFHFAFSDQGLLYHWTKYVKKSVSIVFYDRVENLSADVNGTVYLERQQQGIFANFSKPLIWSFGACQKFMCDFQHFTGTLKPWLRKPPEDLSETTKLKDATYLWWHYLKMVDKEVNLGLDYENWISPGRPSLGLYAKWGDIDKHIAKNSDKSDA
jgi:hypothetical protein